MSKINRFHAEIHQASLVKACPWEHRVWHFLVVAGLPHGAVDGCNLWMIRGTKFLGGLGFGFMGGFSLEHGDKKNCPGGYSGASIECAIGPLTGSSSLGSDWTSTGAGPGWGMELFVISIAKMDPGYPRIVGKCNSK